MSNADEHWNPEDGELPTEAELAEARALAEHLDAKATPRVLTPELLSLVDTALRVKATAHPDPEGAKAVVERSVTAAMGLRQGFFSRPRLRLAVAAAALLVAGTGGLGVARLNARPEHHPITRAATDVFSAAVSVGARSEPSTRIYDSRMHDYRASLLGGRTR